MNNHQEQGSKSKWKDKKNSKKSRNQKGAQRGNTWNPDEQIEQFDDFGTPTLSNKKSILLQPKIDLNHPIGNL